MSTERWPTLDWTRAQLDAALKRHKELGLQVDFSYLANVRPDIALAEFLWNEREDLREHDTSKWPPAPKWKVPPGWPDFGSPWPSGSRLYRLEGLDAWLCVVDWAWADDVENLNPDRHAMIVDHHIGLNSLEWAVLLMPRLAQDLINPNWSPEEVEVSESFDFFEVA